MRPKTLRTHVPLAELVSVEMVIVCDANTGKLMVQAGVAYAGTLYRLMPLTWT